MGGYSIIFTRNKISISSFQPMYVFVSLAKVKGRLRKTMYILCDVAVVIAVLRNGPSPVEKQSMMDGITRGLSFGGGGSFWR